MEKLIKRKTIVTLGEKISQVKIIDDGTAVEITSLYDCTKDQEAMKREEIKGTKEYLKKYFPIVRASSLTLKDDIFKYVPTTENQKDFMEMLLEAVEVGVKDFRAQAMDPSMDEEGSLIYKANQEPFVDKSADEWNRMALDFLPEKSSRLGTMNERIVFLGLCIKYLVKRKRYTMQNAWKAICDQSNMLGNYWDSMSGARSDFEHTGHRKISYWYDFANTFKIVTDNEISDYLQTSGDYTCCGNENPLTGFYLIASPEIKLESSTGWIVMDV